MFKETLNNYDNNKVFGSLRQLSFPYDYFDEFNCLFFDTISIRELDSTKKGM